MDLTCARPSLETMGMGWVYDRPPSPTWRDDLVSLPPPLGYRSTLLATKSTCYTFARCAMCCVFMRHLNLNSFVLASCELRHLRHVASILPPPLHSLLLLVCVWVGAGRERFEQQAVHVGDS